MKKIFFIAVGALVGLVMVSCDTDAIGSTAIQGKHVGVQAKVQNLKSNDSIPMDNINSSTTLEGPGDEIIIITPPKKPK